MAGHVLTDEWLGPLDSGSGDATVASGHAAALPFGHPDGQGTDAAALSR